MAKPVLMDEDDRLLFYNNDGTLTAYGLQCGYIDRVEKNRMFVEIYYEHAHFHVRNGRVKEAVTGWSVLTEYQEARKLFKDLMKAL